MVYLLVNNWAGPSGTYRLYAAESKDSPVLSAIPDDPVFETIAKAEKYCALNFNAQPRRIRFNTNEATRIGVLVDEKTGELAGYADPYHKHREEVDKGEEVG